MASSVIIVLRNFQHSDRDTKDIFTNQPMLFRRRLEHKFKAQQLQILTRTHISVDSSLCRDL
ncbi:unnamed protein product [Porites evermanni]|uniref:Uncharacterized protein n=1 Tax=Porites evermanni TaxID=104178 RepID=A0ABN8SRW7_9CNID|nr:unnamed protein product [Porites evermanni]